MWDEMFVYRDCLWLVGWHDDGAGPRFDADVLHGRVVVQRSDIRKRSSATPWRSIVQSSRRSFQLGGASA